MRINLNDIGEDAIISNYIIPIFPDICKNLYKPDDCSVLSLEDICANEYLIQTSDPCPKPVVFDLFDNDYYHYGWMSVVINVSDIAAMGGKPLNMHLLIDAPGSMQLNDFKRFIKGVSDASKDFEVSVNGGNIRDGNDFSCQVSMTGLVKKHSILTQSSATENQTLFSIGNNGHFWLSIKKCIEIGYKNAIKNENILNSLTKPTPKLKEANYLSIKSLTSCATDASDGLMNAINLIAKSSEVDVLVDLNKVHLDDWYLSQISKKCIKKYYPFLSWGDWQIICSVDNCKLQLFYDEMKNMNVNFSYCGHTIKKGSGTVHYELDGKRKNIADLCSKKFSTKSTEYSDWLDVIF